MNGVFHLRRATRDDVVAILEIYLLSRRTFLPYAPIQYPDDAVKRWIENALIDRGITTVAESSKKIVGFSSLSSEGTIDWLNQLYLSPDSVGTGIGAALLQAALKTSRRPLRLYTSNKT
jgi:GNAT superfamily N-acetyltransferase